MFTIIRVAEFMVSLHSNEILRQKLVPGKRFCSSRTDRVLGGRMCMLKFWIRKGIKFITWDLMDLSCRNMKDSGAVLKMI